MLKIKSIASAFPSRVVDNPTIAQWSGLNETFIHEKIGIRERRFLGEGETGLDLCSRALTELANTNPDFDPAKVRLVICVTQNPDFTLPHMSALIQAKAQVPNNAACFDIALGCSGYVYALAVAKGLSMVDRIQDALIFTCDPYSRIMDPHNRDVIGLFGDASTVTWLSSDGYGEIGRFDFGTDGAGASHLILKSTAANRNAALEGRDASLHMNGRAIFNFMMQRVPESVAMCLRANGVSLDEIDFFLFHQASRFLLETLASRMNLDPDKVPIKLEESGNTVSSTIPIVLEGLLKSGACFDKKLLLSGFGVGLSWATTLLEFGGRNE